MGRPPALDSLGRVSEPSPSGRARGSPMPTNASAQISFTNRGQHTHFSHRAAVPNTSPPLRAGDRPVACPTGTAGEHGSEQGTATVDQRHDHHPGATATQSSPACAGRSQERPRHANGVGAALRPTDGKRNQGDSPRGLAGRGPGTVPERHAPLPHRRCRLPWSSAVVGRVSRPDAVKAVHRCRLPSFCVLYSVFPFPCSVVSLPSFAFPPQIDSQRLFSPRGTPTPTSPVSSPQS